KNELRNQSRNPLVLFQTVQKNWQDEDRPLQFEDTTSRPDDIYRKRHLREIVEESVARLPEHHRNVFILRELEGKSYEEIAEITECNLGTVKSRLNRARNSFAEIIAPYVDEVRGIGNRCPAGGSLLPNPQPISMDCREFC